LLRPVSIIRERILKYDPERHHRRSIRLAGYDYSEPGAYFVTICTHNKELLLEDEQVKQIVRSAWGALPARFAHLTLDEFVTMPNHIHGIIILTPQPEAPLDRGAASSAPTLDRTDAPPIKGAASSAPTAGARVPTLGQVVRAFKSVSAIAANRRLDRSGTFWQRNYYEHIIRDEDELNVVRQYIRDNPLKWDQDPDNPAV